MAPALILTLGVLSVLGLFGVKRLLRAKRRKRLLEAPFPEEWKSFLEKHVYLYRHLPKDLKNQLHGDISIFLAEKRFEGCGGLTLTDEMKVTIAAEACLLLLNRKPRYYPRLVSILVYPGAYVASQRREVGAAFVEEPSVRAGESWRTGTLILAWDHVAQSAQDPSEGRNVVLHEFAHQLDSEHGPTDGVPALGKSGQYREWARVLSHEFQDLQERVSHHRKSVMDAYGATSPAEFFAVATETFFTRPKQMKKHEPELYEELKQLYRLDPDHWINKED